MAQSIKLSYYEEEVEITIKANQPLLEDLSNTGKIKMSNTEITKKLGSLFTTRANVNLHSDMLDTPDCFWEADEYSHVYERMRRYLEIEKRLRVLN
jgi:uncharacterized Rmd1/YagE family protein